MGNHMETAIEQMQQKKEEGLNFLYSKTYNYVYLRAKSILKKETDIQKLMKEVYCQAFAAAAELKEEEMYEWIGKRTYSLGNKYFRRKKAREAVSLELTKNDLLGGKNGKSSAATGVISNCLEQLPEMYQATLYAFYYDYMSITDIAEMFDCSTGVIIHRLNYTAKYLKEAFAMHNEETGKEKIGFSVETVRSALRSWSVENCLGMASAQTLYVSICKELNLKAGSIYLEGKEFAGVNSTVVYYKNDDLGPLIAEIELYSQKEVIDKRKVLLAAVSVSVVVLLGILISIISAGEKEEVLSEEQNQQVENQELVEEEETATDENETIVEEEESIQEDAMKDAVEESVEEESEPAVEEEDEQIVEENDLDSEYIFSSSDKVLLTEEDLEGMTRSELRLARNEIYARYGMVFGVNDLDEYFAEKSWYEPKYSAGEFYDSVELNMIEEANVQFILKIEQSME